MGLVAEVELCGNRGPVDATGVVAGMGAGGDLQHAEPLHDPLRADPDVLAEQALQRPQAQAGTVGELLGPGDRAVLLGEIRPARAVRSTMPRCPRR